MMKHRTYFDHLRDFGDLSWFVLFVERQFDETAAAYAQRIDRELVASRLTNDSATLFDPSGTVAELIDSPWTAVFHTVGLYEPLDTAAMALTLGCRIVEFSAQDTAGVVDLRLFLSDGTSQRYLTPEDVENENQLNEDMGEPPIESYSPIKSYDTFFETLDIATVNLYVAEMRSHYLPEDHAMLVGRVLVDPTER